MNENEKDFLERMISLFQNYIRIQPDAAVDTYVLREDFRILKQDYERLIDILAHLTHQPNNS